MMYGAFWIAISVVTFWVNAVFLGYFLVTDGYFTGSVVLLILIWCWHHRKVEKKAALTRAVNEKKLTEFCEHQAAVRGARIYHALLRREDTRVKIAAMQARRRRELEL